MKKIFSVIFLLLFLLSLYSQSFYYFQGKKINLKVDSTMFVIQTDSSLAEDKNSELKHQLQQKEIKHFQRLSKNRFLIVGEKSQKNKEYISNVYRGADNRMVIIYPRIVVKFRQNSTLHQILNKYNGKLIEESSNNQKSILKCKVTRSEEVFNLVNELSSREDVFWCEPEFFSEYSIDNEYFPNQYYLKNTGQNGGVVGVDINTVPAWSLTSGSDCVVVAVIDQGVDRNHEDFGDRIL